MVNNQQISPVEMRGFIAHITQTQNVLRSLGAEYKGEYVFTDHVYAVPNVDLNTEFVRIRVYQKTQWAQKNVVMVHKRAGKIIVHQEFDSIPEAYLSIDLCYQFLFSFSRTGWEYSWNQMRIFVEDIKELEPTIEVIAASVEQIQSLFELLCITRNTDQSLAAIMSKRL